MDRIVHGLARLLALVGGVVLCLIVAVVCVSIAGRALNGFGFWLDDLGLDALGAPFKLARPVTGDFELVEAGTAFSIFLFWPWCQLARAHAKVDLFTQTMPRGAERLLALVWEVIFFFVIALIAWRLYEGLVSKAAYGETTFMLQFPVWWAYAACLAAAVLTVPVAAWCVWLRVGDLRRPEAA